MEVCCGTILLLHSMNTEPMNWAGLLPIDWRVIGWVGHRSGGAGVFALLPGLPGLFAACAQSCRVGVGGGVSVVELSFMSGAVSVNVSARCRSFNLPCLHARFVVVRREQEFSLSFCFHRGVGK